MRINSLNNFIIGGLLAGASLGLASCNSSFNRLTQYMRDNNYTQKEYEEVLFQNGQYPKEEQPTMLQSTLDSMAYRNLLNTTSAANDSSVVADFNALANRIKISNIKIDNNKTLNPISEKILQILKNENVTINEYEDVKNQVNNFNVEKQHYADKLLYSKFFKKHGLMSKEFQAKFDSIADVIRPTW